MGKVEEWGREGREGVKEGCREEGRGREGRRVVGVEGRLQKQGEVRRERGGKSIREGGSTDEKLREIR